MKGKDHIREVYRLTLCNIIKNVYWNGGLPNVCCIWCKVGSNYRTGSSGSKKGKELFNRPSRCSCLVKNSGAWRLLVGWLTCGVFRLLKVVELTGKNPLSSPNIAYIGGVDKESAFRHKYCLNFWCRQGRIRFPARILLKLVELTKNPLSGPNIA